MAQSSAGGGVSGTEKDMKFGFDISDLHAGRADGTTRYTFELAKRFPTLAPDVDWHYFSSGNPVKSPLATTGSSATRNVQWHISLWPRYWTQSRLPIDLYRERPDVLFMPIQQLPFIRPGKMKTVCVVHDLAFHIYPEQFTYKDWALQHIFSAYAVREADAIIAVSQATANDIAKYYGRSSGVYVVHHGVDHERFKPPTEQEGQASWEKLTHTYPKLAKPYLLYVGQIQPRKNLIRLIEAFERLTTPTQLVIAGAYGWLNEPIYDRIKMSPAAERIVQTEQVPEELLPVLYGHAEALVLPSLYEGFGMTILEAMAAGCPVVTSTVSSMPEVAGGAAVLVDPLSVDDIVRGITEARERRVELIAAGKERAQSFSWDRTATETLSILQTACQ